jgi:hypothetical protein
MNIGALTGDRGVIVRRVPGKPVVVDCRRVSTSGVRSKVDEAMVALGMAVRSVRIRRGWTQRTLEYRSVVHQSTISRFERGQAAGLRFEAVGCMLAALRAHEPIRHRVLIWLEAESAADPRVAPP